MTRKLTIIARIAFIVASTVTASTALTVLVPARGLFAAKPPNRIKPGVRCLLKAYPKHLCGAGPNAVKWCDGTVMAYDDGRVKSFNTRLVRPDLQDQMSIRYPVGPKWRKPPRVNFDPGRFRHLPLFKKMYGRTAAEVRRNLVKIRWVRWAMRVRGSNMSVRVTRINNVHLKVKRIVAELERLPGRYRRFLAGRPGSFHWRVVKGTRRLSAHSFGIALDVGVSRSDYWRWTRPGPDGQYRYRNRMPWKIVEIFEKNGFVWGGKWYHFDTMHFEYRPELLVAPCVHRP